MFAPKGWISLHEIFYIVSGVFGLNGRIGSIEFFGDENFQVTWLYMQEAAEVAVCLTNGNALPVSKTLIFTESPYNNLNKHIDLMVGTVGSAHSLRNTKEPLSDAELSLQYGPFLHLPIIFPREDFDDFLDQLDRQPEGFVDSERPLAQTTDIAQDMSPKAIADAIVELADKGELPKFEDVKIALAPGLSARQFRFAWNLARERRPSISKPGRKPNKTNS